MNQMVLSARVNSVRIAQQEGKASYVALSGHGWSQSVKATSSAAAHASKMIGKELDLTLPVEFGTEALIKFGEARTVSTMTIQDLTDQFAVDNPGRSKSASAATSAA